MSFPTVAGQAVEGVPYRKAQVCLGPKFAQATYKFFLTGTSTPANVYQNGTLTSAFPITGQVTADNYGRFPAIYLDPAVTYKVQFFNSSNVLLWTNDPYGSQLSTVGTSSLSAYGFSIAPTGEVTIPAPNTGGSGVSLTLNAGAIGSAALKLTGTLAGNSALIVNNSATTGAQTATFVATNKPGTAASSPAGWLPITCDGVQYYTPIWHGNPFTPYVSSPSAQGESITANSVTFGGNGLTTATGGTASPGNWFSPVAANIGASYYINITKTAGLSGLAFVEVVSTTATAAPSGTTYTGGTLTAPYNGNTASNYTLRLSTGQQITGCTFTNGSANFTCPSTAISGTPTTVLTVSINSVWTNITAGGLTISSNAQSPLYGSYQLSSSISGLPIVANGFITLVGITGVASPTYNGSANLVLAGNGTATLGGVASSNWYAPTTANVGASYWIYITQTGGTSGTTFTAGAGAWTNITNGGLTVGITGGTGLTNATGTYIIASDSGGVNQLGSGTVTLTGSNVQSANWSGTTPLNLAGNGTATLNGAGTSSWYAPTTANIGSGYYINITRTGGTAGVNFTAAQGSWTNITNSGLTIDIGGYTGDVGTVTASGTYQISNSSSGTPVLGSGTISLSLSGLTLTRTYTSGSALTETAPTGASNVVIEALGGGGGGSSVSGVGSVSAGGGGGFVSESIAVTAGQTMTYTVGGGGAGGSVGGAQPGTGGTPSLVTGTVTGGTINISAGGGQGGVIVGSNVSGGSATGGTTNTVGNGSTGAGTTAAKGGNGISGTYVVGGSGGTYPSGIPSPYGAGGAPSSSFSGGSSGTGGEIAFHYS